jgi:hypothetical protein
MTEWLLRLSNRTMGHKYPMDGFLYAEISFFCIFILSEFEGLIFEQILAHVLTRQEMVLSGNADSIIRHDIYSVCSAKYFGHGT